MKTDSSSFDTTFLNPCVDTNFVTITTASLPGLTYTIGATKKTYAAHDAFTLSFAKSSSHSLCGEIAYAGQFESVAVDGDPLSYTTGTRVFEAESRDMDLLNDPTPRKYQVVASLANYPSS